MVWGTYADSGGSREYVVYEPAGYAAGRGARPLVVMLHGCMQDAAGFALGTRMNALAAAETVLVVYPQQPASANALKCWNWFDPAHRERGRGEVALVAGITRRAMAEYRVDSSRVYLAGISAGGAMAAAAALAYPELYAALGIHSGVAHGAASSVGEAVGLMKQGAPAEVVARLPRTARDAMGQGARPIPAILFHGGRDAVVAPINGRQLADQLAAAGRLASGAGEQQPAPEWREERGRVSSSGYGFTRRVFIDPASGTTVEQWIVDELGHAWSGGSADGMYTDAKGPDATAEMMRFFRGQRRP